MENEIAEAVNEVIAELEPKAEEVIKATGESKPELQEEEKFLPEIPSHVQYLIIGGGTAAMSAFKSIRALDANAKVNFFVVCYCVR